MQLTVNCVHANFNIQQPLRMVVTSEKWAVLIEDNGKTYVVELTDHQQKVKGLGVFNPVESHVLCKHRMAGAGRLHHYGFVIQFCRQGFLVQFNGSAR